MASNVFAMPSSSLLLMFSFAFGLSNARPWEGPAKTAVYRGDNWSPRPTQLPVDPRELFAREHVDVAVCGWVGGDVASPVACASGSSCVHDTIHGYVGCCATSGPCTAGVYTACIDQNSGNSAKMLGLVDSGVYSCPSGSFCYQNGYPGGYSQYNCGNPSQATTVETSFAGQASDLLLQVVYTGVVFTTPPAQSSTTASSMISTSSSSSQTSTSQISSQTSFASSSGSTPIVSPSPTTNPTPNTAAAGPSATTTEAAHSSSTSKAIIGGVVGGLAALTAILGVLLFFLQRRHGQHGRRRAGSFFSGFGEKRANSGFFQKIRPYSSDNFQTMTEREGPAPATNVAVFPNNHLSPQTSDAQSLFFSGDLGDRRRHRDAEPMGSEIDDFARGFNEVARHHQPNLLNIQEGDPEHPYEISGTEIPVSPPQSQHSDPFPLDVTSPISSRSVDSAAMSGLRRGGSEESERRRRERERLMGENKDEEGVSLNISTNSRMHSNVREEGWSPPRLRPSPPRSRASSEQLGEEIQRYQLVDVVPRQAVQILHKPGQLRGSRMGRGRGSG